MPIVMMEQVTCCRCGATVSLLPTESLDRCPDLAEPVLTVDVPGHPEMSVSFGVWCPKCFRVVGRLIDRIALRESKPVVVRHDQGVLVAGENE